jgi:hypothetical protein
MPTVSVTTIEEHMIQLDIPGWGNITLEYLVSDVNGTPAIDGSVPEETKQAFIRLGKHLEPFIVTGNIHRNQEYDDFLGLPKITIYHTGPRKSDWAAGT